MNVHRKSRTGGKFTQIDNAAINDPRLSLKARGLLAVLLSLSPNWKLNLRGLKTVIGADGLTSVGHAFAELKQAGYVVASPQRRDAAGKLCEREYTVYEDPTMNTPPCVGPPQTDYPPTANPALRNTAIGNTGTRNTETQRKAELESASKSIASLEPIQQPESGIDAGAATPTPNTGEMVAGHDLQEYVTAVDGAMRKNMELAKARYWYQIDPNIRKNRSFDEAFGQNVAIAWTSAEKKHLREIATFCALHWPLQNPLNTTGTIIRAAFRNRGKAFQFLKFWAKHNNHRVSLRPYLTLAGGARDSAKRHDVLQELAATTDIPAIPTPSTKGAPM